MKFLWKWIMILGFPFVVSGQSRSWHFSVAAGTVYNIPSGLSIVQQEQPRIHLMARYRTEPFTAPFYYELCAATEKSNKGLALKLTHHKLILENPSKDIQRFSITDGFNLLTLNRCWIKKDLSWWAGGGLVITHPESTIRNLVFAENRGIFNRGYYVSGPVAETGVSVKKYISRHWFASGQVRLSLSYVQIPVAAGYSGVTNYAIHFLFGPGYTWKRME